jgi:glycosyltransferase involved in cell wall biosynthesis
LFRDGVVSRSSVVPEEPYIFAVGTYGRDFQTLINAVKDTGVRTVIATKPERMKGIAVPAHVSYGFYSPYEMKSLYHHASLVVIPLKTQGLYDSVGTLSLGEAFAMAKPVIVSRTQNMESYVEHGVTGLMYTEGDADDLRMKIEELMSSQEKRDRIGKAGYAYAKKYLSLSRFAQKLGVFFKGL